LVFKQKFWLGAIYLLVFLLKVLGLFFHQTAIVCHFLPLFCHMYGWSAE